MTPQQKAEWKERSARALKQMRECGFPAKKTISAIKTLLKSLDYNWELIEAENYSILVDAIISFEEPGAFPGDGEGSRVDDGEFGSPEIPLVRKRRQSNQEEQSSGGEIESPEVPLLRRRRQSSQKGQSSGGQIVLKKPKLEQDPLLHTDVQQNPHHGLERNIKGCTDLVLSPSDALAVAKGKGIMVDSSSQGHSVPISRRVHRRDRGISIGGDRGISIGGDRGISIGGDLPLVNFKEPKIEPDVEPIAKEVGSSTTCSLDGNGSDWHPILSEASVPETSSRSAIIAKDSHLKGFQVRDGYPSIGDGMEATGVQKLNKSEHAKHAVTHPSSTKLELASSSNSKFKLVLSWEDVDADFEMPSRDSILKAVENRMLMLSKNTAPEFSIKKILTEMCQMISEQNRKQ